MKNADMREGKRMGKGTGQIYMDYQAMRQKADRLDELAQELLSIAENEIGSCMTAQNAWQGDSGDVFREKVMKLEKKLEKRAKELKRTAAALRSTAERQYRIEMALAAMVSR